MMHAFGDTVAAVSAAWGGWQPRELDIGGGLPTGRDPTGRAIPRRGAQAGPAPPVERYAEVIASSLFQSLAAHGLPSAGTTLEIEPGRACYASAGVHLSRVINIKNEAEPAPLSFVEVDTTDMFLIDVHLEHNRWMHIVANRASDPPTMVADIVGMSCGFDTIIPDAALPETAPGDVMAFLDTGAYQEACASNFNAMPRPATVLVRDSATSVVRRAETIEDVFRRDVDWPSDISGVPRQDRPSG